MLSGKHLVLIEDDAVMGGSLIQRLELEGATVNWVKTVVPGIAAVRTPRLPVDAVICDIRLPDGTGEDVFTAVSETISPPPFLFITGQGDIDQAVRLMRSGGADYMTKPFEMATFLGRIVEVLRPIADRELPPQTGISPLAREVDARIADAALHERPILIRGQRGLAKARIARHIHDSSDRHAAAFVESNAHASDWSSDCLAAALESIGEGTLFVNGLGRLGRAEQDALLGALAKGSLRLITAAGTRLIEKVEAGAFRSDLYFTLAASEIAIPPLSQRPEDAVWLGHADVSSSEP